MRDIVAHFASVHIFWVYSYISMLYRFCRFSFRCLDLFSDLTCESRFSSVNESRAGDVDRGEGSVFSARLSRVDVIGLDMVVVVVVVVV